MYYICRIHSINVTSFYRCNICHHMLFVNTYVKHILLGAIEYSVINPEPPAPAEIKAPHRYVSKLNFKPNVPKSPPTAEPSNVHVIESRHAH